MMDTRENPYFLGNDDDPNNGALILLAIATFTVIAIVVAFILN